MTVLVDTGVLYADHDTDAARHEAASDALDVVYDGQLGLPYVSDYIYDEAVTLTLTRASRSGRRSGLASGSAVSTRTLRRSSCSGCRPLPSPTLSMSSSSTTTSG
jgi:predicted nucleic acid-binding protein